MSIPSLAGNSPPLVGRERELTVLREHLAAALDGHGSVVLIGGEAGIGKTALAEALCKEAAEMGALVLIGRCYDLTETPPYGPWVELFGRAAHADWMPPLPAAFAQRGAVGDVMSQPALLQQVLDFFVALATHRPLALLLDDLHWADPASLDLLRSLARSLSDLPLLLLGTWRADGLSRRHPLYALLPLLVREARAIRLDLHPLRRDALFALVALRYHLLESDAARLVTYLDERSEGNPLFLTELLRAMEEEETLRTAGDGWALGDLARAWLPPAVRQVIDGRLARLDTESQHLLAVAAIIGYRVPFDLWASVADEDEHRLLDVVAHAESIHIMTEADDGTGATFTHALIREALYESTRPSQRRRWHRRVAEVVAAGPSPDPDAVAYHFRQAGDARAAEWLRRAGDRAWRAGALITAWERYRAALMLAEQDAADGEARGWLLYRLIQVEFYLEPSDASTDYMDGAAAIAAVSADPVLSAAFLFTRGFIDFNTRSIRQGLSEMEAGVAAIDALAPNDRDRLDGLIHEHVVNTGNTPRTTLILHLAIVGRFADAMVMAEAMEGEPIVSIAYSDAHLGQAMALAQVGQVADAQASFLRSREAYRIANLESRQVAFEALLELMLVALPYQADKIGQRRHLATRADVVYRRDAEQSGSEVPSALTLPLLLVEGEWETAWATAESAMRTVRGRHPNRMSRASWAWLARERGDRIVAWEQIGVMLPAGTATEPGNTLYIPAVAMILLAATLCLDAGDLPNAEVWLKLHDRFLEFSGAVLGQSNGQALWAHYHRQAGNAERASRHAERALTHAKEPHQPLALLAAHRLLGNLATDSGRADDAREHLDAALHLADVCAAPFERALTLLALAELSAATDAREDARAFLVEVRAICTPLGATPTLARADALAAQLDAATQPVPAYPAGLSEREAEVLRLVAQGRTNRDIADALFLSEHTVRHHLTHILAKTNAANRAEAAAFAQRHGLT